MPLVNRILTQLADKLLKGLRKDLCDIPGCNEPRKIGGLFPSAYCEGHWFIKIVQPTLSQDGNQEGFGYFMVVLFGC